MSVILWWQDERGSVTGFVALMLPLCLGIGALIFNSGQAYIRQAEMQFVARQAANSSLVPLQLAILDLAQTKFKQQCETLEPPSICQSNRWQDFVSLTETQALAQSPSLVAAVQAEALQFAVQTDPQGRLSAEQVAVEFPVSGLGTDRVTVEVRIAAPVSFRLWPQESASPLNVGVTARSFLSISS